MCIRDRILFHTDCIQAYGKLNCYPKKWKADMISVSGHKIHVPKGIGFIYIKNGTKIKPIIWGGNQMCIRDRDLTRSF